MGDKKPKKVKPKQRDLPGMEERRIPDLHAAAEVYADTRDSRMDLLNREVELKEELLGLMRKHGKKVYLYDSVEIRVVHENETVKVKIHKEKKPV